VKLSHAAAQFHFPNLKPGGGLSLLTNTYLGKMPAKAKARPKASAASTVGDDVDKTSEWGFDKDGNLRVRGPLAQAGEYDTLGSINDFQRKGALHGSAGAVYTLTNSAGTAFKLMSGNFRPVLWDDGQAAGENISESSQAAFRVEAFTRRGPEHVGILDGHARGGSD
jgi:hypothetical protein